MANNNNNNILIAEARNALDRFKYEVANEVGVTLKPGYNGDITSRDAGRIGGNMVKKMVQSYEQSLIGR
ncbi:MAG: alpha/beta-type small acid-soluble spore protein [Eubacteriales bacterium]|nr:alpha/beta-type small acid-soluble spore protein [Eubacteriales bacterium]